MSEVKILGLGHPRTGTGYTATVLNKWGFEIGHEDPKPDGIVSWTLIQEWQPKVRVLENTKHKSAFFEMGKAYDWKRPTYDTLIYNVRNPTSSIPSLVHTVRKRGIIKYLKKLGSEFKSENPIENWIQSIIHFNNVIINLNPDIIYRIEDQEEFLYNELRKKYDFLPDYQAHQQIENARPHPSFKATVEQFGPPQPPYVDLINTYCDNYNYPRVNFS